MVRLWTTGDRANRICRCIRCACGTRRRTGVTTSLRGPLPLLSPPGQSTHLSQVPAPLWIALLRNLLPLGGAQTCRSGRAHWAGRWDDNNKGRLRDSLHTMHRGPGSQDHARENDPALPSDRHWLLVPLPSSGCCLLQKNFLFPFSSGFIDCRGEHR